MMRRPSVYTDLDGRPLCLGHLDADERRLLARIQRRARENQDWDAFDNYWTRAIGAFYDARGVPRTVSRESVVYRVAQDLSSRLGIASGLVRMEDYRDQIEELIEEKYRTRKAFCEATGLAEDTVSDLLRGRLDLSLSALEKALGRIGYTLCIRRVPRMEHVQQKRAAAPKKRTG
jgi:hypothetical protein